MGNNNICFIDFETTGTSLIDDHPIEIGAVLLDNNFNVLHDFHSYIKPQHTFVIKESAFKIHNLSENLISESPNEKEVLGELFSKLGTDYRLAAWNMSFDIAYFKILCHRNSYESYLNKINYRHIDVQTISYVAKEIGCISENIDSFSDLLKYFGLIRRNFHSAIEDAILLSQVYKLLLQCIKNCININYA
jgi:DNA polymerase III subunit epsilon